MNKDPQQQAIEKTTGPTVILAGAGTGKSYTLIEKVNYLVKNNHYSQDEILCLTFSNEAARSLRDDIDKKLGGSSLVTVKTFHSECAEILREDGRLVGVAEDFEILLPDDAKVLMHRDLGIDSYNSGRYITSISTATDLGITLEDIKGHTEKILKELLAYCPKEKLDARYRELHVRARTLHLEPRDTAADRARIKAEKEEISNFCNLYNEYRKYADYTDAWASYDKLKKERNALDYADLNKHVKELFARFGAGKYVKRYKYVLVDEFQDTNKLQFELIEYIASHHNITVVGDPNQSIYAFRGAYRDSFDHFKKEFGVDEKKDVFKLEKSRRSPNTVLNIAHELIKNNYPDPNECLIIQNYEGREGGKVTIAELVNDAEEARYIAETVEKAIESGTPKEEICILHRTHAQPEIIRRALELKGIPVISSDAANLLKRREIKTAIAYLSILSNLYKTTGTGSQSWWDMFQYQNTLSAADTLKIGKYLRGHPDQTIDELLLSSADKVGLSPEGRKTARRIESKLKELVASSNRTVPDLVLDIYELSGLSRAFTHERTVANIESMLNLRAFHALASNYHELHGKTLPDFIEYLEIMEALDLPIDASKVENQDAVRLMTIHGAKGLEYDLVIVSNMAKGRFPIKRTQKEPLIPKELLPDMKEQIASWGSISEDELEKKIKEYEEAVLLYEERRLCYVAWTRAKKDLVLTYALKYGNQETEKSKFLAEINYKENKNCAFISDIEEKSAVIAPDSPHERHMARLKEQILNSLDTDDLASNAERLVKYYVCRERKAVDYKAAFKDVSVSAEEMEEHLARAEEALSGMKFNPKEHTFSPSSLKTYDECPKKYELSRLYHMPERGAYDEDDGNGTNLGSFIHAVLEEGVKAGYKKESDYNAHADRMMAKPEWAGIDKEEAHDTIKVFWARNRDQIGTDSETEVELKVEIGGFQFKGYADRIDKPKEGERVVDYKTGTGNISPQDRAWQLGYYAIALQKMNRKVSTLILDLLRQDKPVEMTLDGNGNATAPGNTRGFNLKEVEEELIGACKGIAHDYEHEFEATGDGNGCRYCGYKFYCPRWEER